VNPATVAAAVATAALTGNIKEVILDFWWSGSPCPVNHPGITGMVLFCVGGGYSILLEFFVTVDYSR